MTEICIIIFDTVYCVSSTSSSTRSRAAPSARCSACGRGGSAGRAFCWPPSILRRGRGGPRPGGRRRSWPASAAPARWSAWSPCTAASSTPSWSPSTSPAGTSSSVFQLRDTGDQLYFILLCGLDENEDLATFAVPC